MKYLFLSILTAIGSLFGFHSSVSQPATNTSVSSSVQIQQINTEVATASSTIPALFLNYSIVYGSGTSTSTAKSDIYDRLKNTYIKNKITGTTTSLLSPSVYSSWNGLLYSGEVIGDALYAGIQTSVPENNQTMSIDLWKSSNNGQPTLLYKNIDMFSVSGDGYVAVSDASGDSAQTITILNPQGSVIKTISLSQVNFCSVPADGEGIGLMNWSGHNLWLACEYTDNSPKATYLEINEDTFQITKNSQPPSELGM